MSGFYRAIVIVCRIINRIAFGIKITNKKNLMCEGSVVLVSNHKSVWDPLLVGPEFKMEVHYLAKAELFKSKIFGFILGKGLKAIPINRGEADYNALKASIQILKDKKCLGVFPEGTRVKGEIGEFQRGFAAIAIKGRARILPVCIDGDYKFFRKMHLIVGDPIDMSEICDLKDRDAASICAKYIREKIIELRDQYSIYK